MNYNRIRNLDVATTMFVEGLVPTQIRKALVDKCKKDMLTISKLLFSQYIVSTIVEST
jgi:hypothetical protein